MAIYLSDISSSVKKKVMQVDLISIDYFDLFKVEIRLNLTK